MGYFKDLEIDIIDMYHSSGMKEVEIAKSLGLSLIQVHDVLAAYERGDLDYDENDTDADPEMVSYDDLTFDPGAEHY
jgi:transposase